MTQLNSDTIQNDVARINSNKSHNRTLIDTISERAHSTYGKPLDGDTDYPDWEAHYIKTAILIRDEFEKENLQKTAAKMDDHINFFIKWASAATLTILSEENITLENLGRKD